MVDELPNIKRPKKLFQGCLVDKQQRKPFDKHIIDLTTSLLDLVYPDVCGPISELSLAQICYFITFVDNYNRKGHEFK